MTGQKLDREEIMSHREHEAAMSRVWLLAALLSLSAIGLDATTIAASSALHVDQFRAVYEAPKDPAHQALYEDLKAARSLERLREFLSFIRLPRVLTLKLAGCDGDDNAESRLKT